MLLKSILIPICLLLVILVGACTKAETPSPTPALSITSSPVITLTPAPSATEIPPRPTFTLVPTANAIDAEITALYQNGDAQLMLTVEARQHPERTQRESLTAVPTLVQGFAWTELASDIIKREMQIDSADIDTSSVLGKTYVDVRIDYRLKEVSQPSTGHLVRIAYLARIPYALCSLRDSRFDSTVALHIYTVDANSRPVDSAYFCTNAETINQINCTAPSQTKISALDNVGNCSK